MRTFLTRDGEVLEQTEWATKPTDVCFYCDMPLIYAAELTNYCPKSMNSNHDWITLVNPQTRR